MVDETRRLMSLNEYLKNVFIKMAVALGLTALTSFIMYLLYLMPNSLLAKLITNDFVLIILCIIQMGVTFFLGFKLKDLSSVEANKCLGLYSVLTGVSLGTVPLAYDMETIFIAFANSALLFVVLAVIGMTTNVDLSKFKTIFMASLIALLIGEISTMFIGSGTYRSFLNYAGIFIFMLLTVLDIQNIKEYYNYSSSNEEIKKMATFGALELYIDVINIFVYMLRETKDDD